MGLARSGALVVAILLVAPNASSLPKRLSTAVRCASDEAQARDALARLAATRDSELELPPSLEHDGHAHRASAAEVDEILYELHVVRSRFPRLAASAEALVVGYRYCAIFDGTTLWDVVADGGVTRRVRPTAAWPVWRGFEAWGFLGARRPAPALVEDGPLGHDQRGWYLGELASERCFPHPIFGVERTERPSFEQLQSDTTGEPAPAIGEPCDGPSVPPSSSALASAPPRPAKAPVRAVSPSRSAAIVAVPASALGAAMATSNDASGLGFAGRFVIDGKLDGVPSAGAGVSYSPRPGYFARVGVMQRLGAGPEATSYSYGLGYDDWHEGTFSAQLNDWGPRSFEARPNLASAAVDLGYKVPLPKALGRWLSCGVSLNFPFSAAPGTVVTTVLKPFGDLYVLAGLRMSPFASTFGTWFYGFGFSSYHPFTFGLAYANWGPNKAFVPNFDKGSVVGTFSWAL